RLQSLADEEADALAQPVDARSHCDDAVLEINILPVQTDHFRTPQTESERQIHQCLERVALNDVQQSAEVLYSWHLVRFARLPRRVCLLGNVARQMVALDGDID